VKSLRINVFWDVTPCSVVDRCIRFGGTFSPSSLESKFDPKKETALWYISTILYGVTSHKTVILLQPQECQVSDFIVYFSVPDFGKRWWIVSLCRGCLCWAHYVWHMRPSHFCPHIHSRCSSWESSPEAGVRYLITSSGCVRAVNRSRLKEVTAMCVITAVMQNELCRG
jgi:hypothetical protein